MASVQQQRLWINAVMLIVALVLIGFIIWWSSAKPIQQAVTLLPLTVADVQTIRIERNPSDPTADSLRFAKKEAHWQLLEPQVMRANTIKVRQLLTLLEDPVSATYPAVERDLSQYGLEPGLINVYFNDQKLTLGHTNPVSQQRYVLQDGTIKLVNEGVFATLESSWLDFVDLKLLAEGSKVESVILPTGQASAASVPFWQQASAVKVELLTTEDQGRSVGEVRIKTDQGELAYQLILTADELILGDVSRGLGYHFTASQKQDLLRYQASVEADKN